MEAAFVLPILLTFMFGLIDLGMWTLNANQATNAARDGARAAIIDFKYADDDEPPSAHYNAVVEAVEDRLTGQDIESVEVTCVDRFGAELVSCEGADLMKDSIRVDVRWNWTLITPVAAILGYDEGAATGTATMRIVGRPLPGTSSTSTTTTTTPDTTTPTDCEVAEGALTVSPSPIYTTGNGASQLSQALDVTFTTNGDPACDALAVELFDSNNQKRTTRVECGCDETDAGFTWSYVGSDNVWKPGFGEVRVLDGTRVLRTKTFEVRAP